MVEDLFDRVASFSAPSLDSVSKGTSQPDLEKSVGAIEKPLWQG